jgi:hypothetical protein
MIGASTEVSPFPDSENPSEQNLARGPPLPVRHRLPFLFVEPDGARRGRSAGAQWSLAVVVVAVLAAWLIAVFLAARQPRDKSAAVSAGRRDEETAATVTQLPSDDRPSGKAAALSGITPRPHPAGRPGTRVRE